MTYMLVLIQIPFSLKSRGLTQTILPTVCDLTHMLLDNYDVGVDYGYMFSQHYERASGFFPF